MNNAWKKFKDEKPALKDGEDCAVIFTVTKDKKVFKDIVFRNDIINQKFFRSQDILFYCFEGDLAQSVIEDFEKIRPETNEVTSKLEDWEHQG